LLAYLNSLNVERARGDKDSERNTGFLALTEVLRFLLRLLKRWGSTERIAKESRSGLMAEKRKIQLVLNKHY